MIVCFLQRITILFLSLFLFLNTIQASAYLPFCSVPFLHADVNVTVTLEWSFCFRGGRSEPEQCSRWRWLTSSSAPDPVLPARPGLRRVRDEPVHRFQPLLINCDRKAGQKSVFHVKESPTRPTERLFLPVLATAATRRCLVLYKVQRKRFIRFLFKVKCKKN